MAYLNCLINLLPSAEASRLPEIGWILLQLLLVLAVIAAIVALRVLYIRTLRLALERCSPASRTISPEAGWLLLIPIFSGFWHFLVVSRMATSLGAENKSRNLSGGGPQPGKLLGMAMCILPFAGAGFAAVAVLSSTTVATANLLTGIWLAFASASLVCWIAYWMRIAGYSKAIATPSQPEGAPSAKADGKPEFPYRLIGIIGLSVCLLPPVAAAVIYLIPGLTGQGADTYAVIYPHWYSRYLGSGEKVSRQKMSQMAHRELMRQNPKYAGVPQIVSYVEQQAGQRLVQQQVLMMEAERLGIRAHQSSLCRGRFSGMAEKLGVCHADDDVRQFLRQGQIGKVLYPNGEYIGDDKYAQLISENFNLPVREFEDEVWSDIVIRRLEALITGGITVSDAEVREIIRREGARIKFDYAVISADDVGKTINPSEGELEAYFRKNQARYATVVPEQRRITYFAFTTDQLPGGVPHPSQQEIQQYYAAHQSDYTVPGEARSRHILIMVPRGADERTNAAAQAKAEGLLRQIRSGASFADLAKRFSDDPGSKNNGGELGFAKRGNMVPEFENAIFTQEIGDTQIVRTEFGYHIVQVEERNAAHVQPINELLPTIQATLVRQSVAKAEQEYAQALAAEAGKNGLEKTAQAHQLPVTATPLFGAQGTIAGVADSVPIVGKTFDSKLGDPPQFAPTGEGYAVFQVTGIAAAHAPSFADWKSHVAADDRSELLPALLSQKTLELAEKAKAENDLAGAAREEGATFKSSDLVGFGSQVPGLGMVGKTVPQLFDLSVGQISGPINAQGAGVVAKILDKQEPSAAVIAANLDPVKEQILNQRRTDAFKVFLSNTLEKYKKDHRVRMIAHEETPGLMVKQAPSAP